MKPEIIITKSELTLLVKTLLKTQPQKFFIESETAKEINMVIELQIGENRVNLITSKHNWEWAEILEEIHPMAPIGDETVPIDWEGKDQGQIMDALDEFSEHLTCYIDSFTVEVVEPSKNKEQ